MPITTPAEFARYYARRGFALFPLGDNLDWWKFPAWKGWQEKASSNPRQVEHHWTENPKAGLAILCGLRSDLVVLDIDLHDYNGFASLEEMQRDLGELPPTARTISGTGGVHLFFRYPEGFTRIKNGSSIGLYMGVDRKADGGYVVAAPTVNLKVGNAYRFDSEASLLDIPVLPYAPAWLCDLRGTNVKSRKAGTSKATRKRKLRTGGGTKGEKPKDRKTNLAPRTQVRHFPERVKGAERFRVLGLARHILRESGFSGPAVKRLLQTLNRRHLSPRVESRAVENIARKAAGISRGFEPGIRNQSLYEAGVALRRLRFEQREVEHELAVLNRLWQGSNPLDEDEVAKITGSVMGD